MSKELDSAIVRILNLEGRIFGAGFLVRNEKIVSCAHAVSDALGLSEPMQHKPYGDVYIDFPFIAPKITQKARVAVWKPENEVAVLELYASPPSGIYPVPLILEENVWGHPFRAFGFPEGYDNGVWAGGVLRARNAYGWVQIEGMDIGYRIESGFSGTPVWDEELGGVVGMVSAVETDSGKRAFLIPISAVVKTWPEILPHHGHRVKATKPNRQLEVFLCHASDDRLLVRELYHQLVNDGFKPWLDEMSLLPGQRWQIEIPKAVRSSDAVVICLSRNSTSKAGYVQKEIKYALDIADEKPEDGIFLIPVRLEKCEVPERLRLFQWVDLFQDGGYERLISSLQLCAQATGAHTLRSSPRESTIFQTPSTISILLLAANPVGTARLRLDEESREIQEKLRLAKFRERFTLHQRWAIRPTDLSQSLLDTQPDIVHFSGHGTDIGALYIENQTGETQTISPEALAALFEQFAGQIKCVVLNACHSEAQANAISEYIDYVIGTNQAINDRAAIAFVVGFYQALGAGRTMEDAYKLGCAQIKLQGVPEHLTPILIKRVRMWGYKACEFCRVPCSHGADVDKIPLQRIREISQAAIEHDWARIRNMCLNVVREAGLNAVRDVAYCYLARLAHSPSKHGLPNVEVYPHVQEALRNFGQNWDQ